jgi:hypothetical protein
VLAVQAQGVPAGGEDPDSGRAAQQVVDEPGAVRQEVLAVVQHQQRLLVPQQVDDLVQGRPGGALGDAEGAGDRVGDPLAVGQDRQVDEPDAVRERPPHLARDVQGQPGLADAAHPGERHQPGLGQQPADVGELPAAPDETGDCRGQRPWCTAGARTVHRDDPKVRDTAPAEPVFHQPETGCPAWLGVTRGAGFLGGDRTNGARRGVDPDKARCRNTTSRHKRQMLRGFYDRRPDNEVPPVRP